MGYIHKSFLDNGVKVVIEEMAGVRSVSIGVWIKRGSAHESLERRGISHFLEHLLFKGTRRRTALDIARDMESVGGLLNAFTSREYTCFYAKVLAKDVGLAVDILSDILINSTFRAKELEKERFVVLQEISMVEDTPDDLIHDLLMERLWKGHPAGWAVLGTKQGVAAIRRKDVLDYFKNHYTPENMIITVAVDIRHKNMIKLFEESFTGLKRRGVRKRTSRPRASRGVKVIRRPLEQVHLCMGVPAPSLIHPHRYRVHMLNTILGGGMSSRLFQEVREKRGLAYAIYSYLNLMRSAGSLVVYAGTSKEEVGDVVTLILKEYERLKKRVNTDELRVAREQLKGGILMGLESTENRMTKLARDEIYFNRTVPADEIIAAIDSIKVRDVKNTAEELLDTEALTVVAIGDVEEEELLNHLNRKKGGSRRDEDTCGGG